MVEGFVRNGLAEDSLHVGDRFSVESAEVVITQPRFPRYKLDIRFGSDDMVKRFLKSTGFYLAVTQEGEVGAKDNLTLVSHDPDSVPMSEMTRLYVTKDYGPEDGRQVRRAIAAEALPEARARIAAAQKARWAKAKRAAKKSG